jgi:2-polyprenyl-3-methyl-5-hydroxy-6-metoxy-1,4-benzoquinol methylase
MNEFEETYWDFQIKERGYSFETIYKANIMFLNKVKKYVDKRKKLKVLDIGCGYGFLLKLLEKENWDVYGADISQKALKEAVKNSNATLKKMNIERELKFEENVFDIITMFDLIEHLNSPYISLKNVKRLLKPGGILGIHCPNANAIGRILAKKQWFGIKDRTHKYFFTSFSLEILAVRAGFEILETATPFLPLPKCFSFMGRSGLGGAIVMISMKPNGKN